MGQQGDNVKKPKGENATPKRSTILKEGGSQAFPIWQSVISLTPIAVAVGFIMAYIYELGYCSIYGIPNEFIQLQSTNIISIVVKVFLSFFLLFWVIFFLLLYVNDPNRKRLGPISRRLLLIVFFILAYIGLAFGYYRAFQEWYLILPIFVYFTALFFIGPLWTQKSVTGGYIEKLAAQDKADRKTPYPLTLITKNAGGSTIGIVLFVSLLLLLSYFSGEDTATRQEYFLVPSTNENSVVLRIYGDELICTQLDNQSNKPNGNLFILKLDDEPRPILSSRKVGPLVNSPQ